MAPCFACMHILKTASGGMGKRQPARAGAPTIQRKPAARQADMVGQPADTATEGEAHADSLRAH